MKVFCIKQEFHALREIVEAFEVDENGEFIDRSAYIAELLEDIQGTASDKLDNIEYIKRELSGGAEVLDAEIKRLSAKKKTLENRVGHLKELQIALLHEVDNKCKTDKFSFSVKKTKAVELSPFVDAEMLPEEYQTSKTTITPNKKALKEAIEAGVVIDGVCIVENESVGVR